VNGGPTLTYTAIKQVFPLGVLFHFPETALDNIKEVHYPPQSDVISSIRATQIEEDGMTSRIFIALKKDLPYNITPEATGIHIAFPKSGKLADKAAEQQAPAEKMEPAPLAEKKMAAPATRITAISTTPLKKSVVINVKADGTIKNYKSFTIEEAPPRIVYDLYGLKSPYKGEQRIGVKSSLVTRVRHFGHKDKVRIVVETKKAYLGKFGASAVDNGLLIHVGQAPPAASQATAKPAPAETTKAAAPAAAKPAPAEATPAPAAASDKPTQHAWLNRIDFSSEEEGKSAVLIGTTRPVEYQITKVADKTKSGLSKEQAYVLQRAQTNWKQDPLIQIQPKLSREEEENRKPLVLESKIVYTGFLQMGDKRLAIINGIEYEVGDKLQPSGLVVRKIDSNHVVIGSSVKKNKQVILPMEEIE
jgi:type IV pilus assembly protein PilQ